MAETQHHQHHHIVMLPFMAKSHILPFLSLADFLLHHNQYHHPRRHFTITLLNTPLNIRRLRDTLPQHPHVRLHALPFSSSDHGLPPGTESADSLVNGRDIVKLIRASESFRPHVKRLLSEIAGREGRPPLCLLADVFFGWSVGAAREAGVFHAAFTTCGSLGTATYMSIYMHCLPHLDFNQEFFRVPSFPENFTLHRSQMSDVMRDIEGEDNAADCFRELIPLSLQSNCLLCNTVADVEANGVELLQKVSGLPVFAMGPLLFRRSGSLPDHDDPCTGWLRRQEPESVVYVSFGTMQSIRVSHMWELARGLEASEQPFIWVLRSPLGFDPNGEFRDEWMPPGFEKKARDTNQGFLVKNSWAPQLDILEHEATGAFLSHCGWNSTLESLTCGVPMIAWPLGAEQFYNSKMLEEEFGVSVELARGHDCEIRSGEVARVVRAVMRVREGEEMRRRVRGIAEKMRAAMKAEGEEKGCSVKALEQFIESALLFSGK